MNKSKKKLFWFIMVLFVLNIFLIVGGIGFLFVGEFNIGCFWLTVAIGGAIINIDNLRKNLKS
jgi:hypothetical protein